ncbi:hypothetical protein LTSEWAN_3192 [Salmonella enterica subsp. enterica serovar Wandsworth str. A4-580]|uniref:Uncharacterized protein n=1 Tax=Salmonella enterica subsp. enterica serovar Wandsworth str. A4-580 TaxID=913086 RepID=G5SD44_SALET|nr:hypothetical protein LTSEWAN_3192 [Salmonella enterica subsp. enterica serovar Wandsworth str. A4-580]
MVKRSPARAADGEALTGARVRREQPVRRREINAVSGADE